jgi:hypothetical protein
MIFVEYELDYKSLQLLEWDCLRLDDSKLSLIRNVNCYRNDMKKLISHMKSIREDKFLNKYKRIVKIMKVSMQNSAIKALMHFYDPEYRCFTFRNVDVCPTLKEYGLSTKFPWNLHKIYFYQRWEKVLTRYLRLCLVCHFFMRGFLA